MKIGVLAIQGDFAEHAAMLRGLGVEAIEVPVDLQSAPGFDFGVDSVHSAFTMERSRQTARVIAAMHNPAVNAIGHLTGRRIGRRSNGSVIVRSRTQREH